MTTTFICDVGVLIGVQRRHAGLSQKELAQRVGLSPQYVCDIESNRRPLRSPKVIQRFADALAISPDVFYFAAGLLPPDITGDYAPERIRAAFDAMRKVLA